MNKKNGMPPGIQLTNRGYARYTKGGSKIKWKLVHRRVMEIALENTHPLTLVAIGIELDDRGKIKAIPERYDIHHVSNKYCERCKAAGKLHNCLCNLWLLDHSLHAQAFS